MDGETGAKEILTDDHLKELKSSPAFEVLLVHFEQHLMKTREELSLIHI